MGTEAESRSSSADLRDPRASRLWTMRFVVLAAAAAVALGAPGLSRRYRWVAMGVAILLLALGEVVVGRVLARRRAARLPRPGEVKDPAGPRGTA